MPWNSESCSEIWPFSLRERFFQTWGGSQVSEPVLVLKHATRISTEQTSMRTKWFENIVISLPCVAAGPSARPISGAIVFSYFGPGPGTHSYQVGRFQILDLECRLIMRHDLQSCSHRGLWKKKVPVFGSCSGPAPLCLFLLRENSLVDLTYHVLGD